MSLGRSLFNDSHVLQHIKRTIKRIVSIGCYSLLLLTIPRGNRPNRKVDKCEIAVVFFASLGDFIVFCRIAEVLYNQNKKITLICRKDCGIEEFAELTPYFDKVIPLTNNWADRVANLDVLKGLQTHTVIAAPLNRHMLTDLYVLAIAADERILPNTNQAMTSSCFRDRVNQRIDRLLPVTKINEMEKYCEFLSNLGFGKDTPSPFILPKSGIADTKVWGLAVFPGAGGGNAKCWSTERFARVIKLSHEKYGISVLLLGTKSDYSVADSICKILLNPSWLLNRCGETQVGEVIHLLTQVQAVLSNDSGSAHIAISCDVPTVIIAGGWELNRFYPNPYLGDKHSVVLGNTEGLMCLNCGESRPTCTRVQAAACINVITVGQVWNAVDKVLDIQLS